MPKQISRGYRKYIREEKARIRREVLDLEERKRLIKQLYSGIKDPKKINKK